jgi:hypothetical protein
MENGAIYRVAANERGMVELEIAGNSPSVLSRLDGRKLVHLEPQEARILARLLRAEADRAVEILGRSGG